jgi:hypothetical protein
VSHLHWHRGFPQKFGIAKKFPLEFSLGPFHKLHVAIHNLHNAVRCSALLGTKTSSFKFTPRQPGLTDDGSKCSNSNFIMVWDRNRYCALGKFFLHDDVATAATDFYEAMRCQNRAYLSAR